MAFDVIIGRNEADMKLLGKQGTVLIGKSYVKMGRTTSLSNPIHMDIAKGHVIYIVGKRGSGKCVSPNTKIQIANNVWLTAEDIYKNYTEGGKLVLKNKKETLFELKKEVNVKSMDENLILASMPVSHIYRKKVNEKLYRIHANEREIIVTKEHPLLVSDKSGLFWLEAGKLKEGNTIAIPQKAETALALVSKEGYSYTATAQEVIFATIDKIESFHYSGYVYDLTVPYTHNFIAGENGGIVCHNSYTMGAIAEGIMDLPDEVRKNLAMIMMDTMGVYWTMKYPNQKDEDLLELWGLQGKGMDVKIYTPAGFFQKYKDDGIPTDFAFAIKPSDLTSQDWILGFELDSNSAVAILIEKTLGDMADAGITDYSINDIMERISADASFEQETRNEAVNRLRAAERWGLFDENGMDMMELVKPGQISILDLSPYVATPGGWGVKALVLGLVGMRVFTQRMLARKAEELDAIKIGYSYFQAAEEIGNREPLPLVWLVVDECLPTDSIVITSKNHTPIGDIYKRFKNGEAFKVLGYNTETNEYGYYDVTNVWEKPAREMVGLVTETGRLLKCTPEHKVLSKYGFLDAIECKEIAVPLKEPYSERPELIKARLTGHIFGDGWSSPKTKDIGFSGKGCNKDLEQIKNDLSALGLKSSNIHTRATCSEITNEKGKKISVKGTSQSIHASHKAFEYFSALGIPQGEKAICEYGIPEWIKNASKEEKAEFLAALIGSDGTIISPAKKVPSDFNPVRLSFNKIEDKEENAVEFANDISALFCDLGIEVSNICKREGNLRKDGKKTLKAVITIAKNTANMIRFLENVGYRYCARKEKEAQRWLSYLKARKRVVEEREILRQKALELQKQGLGKTRIAKKLGVKEYEAREWIYSKGKAGVPKVFPSFREWVSERENEGVLFEKVISRAELPPEKLYDISVDKVHNFVANGCIVHNCHEFLPREGKTAATDALVTIMREGRQPGVCLILATQQPGKIHSDVMSQSDIIIAHRLTAKPDVDALASMSQSYLAKGLPRLLDELPRVPGAALILDDNSERFYPMRVRPRLTWHGGAAPSAIKYKRKVEFGL
ncbi:MAG: hypothetical protein QME12_07160 [Nanoarchaeota archaeon]|nr:hypothetical protein [Nanoarchaeota archaeon]